MLNLNKKYECKQKCVEENWLEFWSLCTMDVPFKNDFIM